MMSEIPVRWLSPRSAARYCDVSYRTLLAWAGDGTIKGVVRIRRRDSKGRGRHVCTLRVDRIALDKFLESRVRS
jgi:hypothetical protein